jgi:DNA-binding beta-propeller fold protein YncE
MRAHFVFGLVFVAACGGHATIARSPAPAARPTPTALSPGGAHEGSTVVTARHGTRPVAFVLDEDDGVIHTVDLDRHTELTTTPAGGVPARALLTDDGRLLVLLRDRARVQVFAPGATAEAPLTPKESASVADEPVALALTPDGGTLLVTSAWGARLTVLDARTLAVRFEVPLAREPRAVIVANDGKRAFVAHMVGSQMSVVDLDTKKVDAIGVGGQEISATKAPRKACQNFALAKSIRPDERILAPEVLVDTGDLTQRPSGYGSASSGEAPETATVAVIDVRTETAISDPLVPAAAPPAPTGKLGARAPSHACLLPRAAAVDEARGHLLVACLGNDELVAYDAAALDPHALVLHAWHVGAGPTGVALDPEKTHALVWSQFDRTLSFVDLGGATFEERLTAADSPVVYLPLSRRAQPAVAGDVDLGRRLFHSVGDRRISADGRACASCHPDGRDDALTWATPEGPRQTPMLAGRLAASAPYGWTGSGADMRAHLKTTFQRLSGAGLSNAELDALVAYAGSMAPPPRLDRGASAASARGREIFESFEAGCSSCHGDGLAPDGHTHDVRSNVAADVSPKFDTPSLRFVAGTAPYFHDGRYLTLHDLLLGTSGRMGQTLHLSPQDLAALEAYLATL